MSVELAPEPPKKRRRLRPFALGLVGFAITLGGIGCLAFFPLAPWIVETVADGRAVWRLGRIELDGVSGSSLGDLVVKRLTIADEKGVWVEAHDVALGWTPLALLSGDVRVQSAAARDVHVFRRPELTAPRPPGKGSIAIDLKAFKVGTLVVDEPVVGRAARFSVEGALNSAKNSVDAARLDLVRLDAKGDALHVRFDRNAERLLDLEATGGATGFFAAALGVKAPVELVGSATGSAREGAGRILSSIGGKTWARAEANWSSTVWSAHGEMSLNAAPALWPLAQRFGDELRVAGKGALAAPGKAAPFGLTLAADNAHVEAIGALDSDWRPTGPVKVAASAPSLSRLTGAVKGGAGRFDGEILLDRAATRVEGRIAGTDVRAGGVTASFAGPMRLRLTDIAASFDADLDLGAAMTPEALARLARNGRLTLSGVYDRGRGRLQISDLALKSPLAEATGKGSWGKTADLSGSWRIERLNIFDRRLRGAAAGAWSLTRKTERGALEIVADGKGRGFASDIPAIGPLFGSAPSVAARLHAIPGGVAVDRVEAVSPKLRATATGKIVDGRLDVALRGSAHGPIEIGSATIDGAADVTGALSGKPEALAVTADADLSEIDLAGIAIERPRVHFDLSPQGRNRAGRLEVKGVAYGEPASATATLATTRTAFALENLHVSVAGLAADGRAEFADAGPSVDVAVAGRIDKLARPVTGTVAGRLSLNPGSRGGDPLLSAQANLRDGRVGEIRLRSLALTANGPLGALGVEARLDGRAGREAVRLASTGRVALRDGVEATFGVEGAVNGSALASTAPIKLRLSNGGMSASGAVSVGSGAAEFELGGGRAFSARARIRDLPLRPIFIFFGQAASGTATGDISAGGGASSLTGSANLSLSKALVASRMREPLDARVDASLQGGMLRVNATATSVSGLEASVEGEAPVDARAQPLRIALAGTGTAAWRVHGPAGALWGVVGTLDQRVTGTLDGAGSARFSVGKLAGEGSLTLTDGGFSDRLSGVELRSVAASLSFTPEGAKLDSFSARDRQSGTLTGTGVVEGVGAGRLELAADRLRFLDRPEAVVTASGPLVFAWTPKGATLDGDLRIARAELTAPNKGNRDIPQLDVVEINLPESDADDRDGEAPKKKAGDALPVTLNVRVRANGQLFLRGRGLDSEWTADVRATGDARNPRLVGEARLLRGAFDLASRRFDLTQGLVRFGGAPMEAQINIVAERETSGLTARISLTGPIADPTIDLSSTPALPEDEILPQVLFGQSIQDLSPLEAAELAGGLAQLAGQSSLDVVGAARNLIGLDRFDVRNTDQGLTLAGGKYLTRDVYLEVSRTGLGETHTDIEWRLKRQLYLISGFSPTGDRRISIRWRREY